jgi:hypothetical protein
MSENPSKSSFKNPKNLEVQSTFNVRNPKKNGFLLDEIKL